MNSEDWRDYATALDGAANDLEAFTRRLAVAAGADQFLATPEGVDGYRTLKDTNDALVKKLRRQADQARLKHETP